MGPTSRFVICGKTIEIERHRGDLLAIRPPQPEDGRVGGVCHWALLPRVGALLRAPILRLPSAHGQHRPLTVSPLIHKLSAHRPPLRPSAPAETRAGPGGPE